MRGLYAILDADFLRSHGVSLLPFAERVLSARPCAIQLRAKQASARDTVAMLRALRPLASVSNVPLFANDRPDLAVLGGADGVHVGQEDLDVRDVRRFAPALRVGVSTHTLGELETALALAPDYVAFGPVYATRSKENPDPVVGVDGLRAARARAGAVPIVAIGGIDLARAPDVAAFASAGAVISGLLPENGLDGVRQRALDLARALEGNAPDRA